jgi:hypothetical protein
MAPQTDCIDLRTGLCHPGWCPEGATNRTEIQSDERVKALARHVVQHNAADRGPRHPQEGLDEVVSRVAPARPMAELFREAMGLVGVGGEHQAKLPLEILKDDDSPAAVARGAEVPVYAWASWPSASVSWFHLTAY